MGENAQYDRMHVDAEDSVRREGDGEGVQRSESQDPCSSSSPVPVKGSSFGKFTVSSAL